jgi:glyoxylase-like metal-dependent hydrolase (beta-lactamase superfamily II)
MSKKTRFVVFCILAVGWSLGSAWVPASSAACRTGRVKPAAGPAEEAAHSREDRSGKAGPDKAAPEKAAPDYEVYAIRFATITGMPTRELVKGADPKRESELAMMFWLIKGPGGRNILVDSGFHHQHLFKGWNIKDYVTPTAALSPVGLKPEDITDIIISHMHWDHVDGIDLFPKATVWIQKDEYGYYTGQAWQNGKKPGGVDAGDVMTLVKMNLDHRVVLVDGDDQEPIPGIKCYTGGRHTYASQYVSVKTSTGTVVIASDNMYMYENLEKHVPIGATFDAASAESNLKAQDRMKQIASRPDLIVPGHDPLVFTKFPEPGNGVARIR